MTRLYFNHADQFSRHILKRLMLDLVNEPIIKNGALLQRFLKKIDNNMEKEML